MFLCTVVQLEQLHSLSLHYYSYLRDTFIITTTLSYYWPMLRTTCVYSFLKSRRRSKITTLIDYLFVYFFLKKIPKSFFMHLPLCRNYENRQKKEACKNILIFMPIFVTISFLSSHNFKKIVDFGGTEDTFETECFAHLFLEGSS